ncbi:hypothetical protein P8936_09575 [Edaphobacter paludis]|uniref:Uncharacterized protein n=1 Tax=Edaphobacter paludis TaxID=3035702 RepID=A0AAU7D2I8_9BACT
MSLLYKHQTSATGRVQPLHTPKQSRRKNVKAELDYVFHRVRNGAEARTGRYKGMQVAHGWQLHFVNQLADRHKAEAVSAGTEPGLRVHPEVLAVFQEIGIDLSEASKITRNWRGKRNCSSQWAAETNANMFQGCAGMIGL